MTALDLIDSGGLLAFAGLIYLELRQLRPILQKLVSAEQREETLLDSINEKLERFENGRDYDNPISKRSH